MHSGRTFGTHGIRHQRAMVPTLQARTAAAKPIPTETNSLFLPRTAPRRAHPSRRAIVRSSASGSNHCLRRLLDNFSRQGWRCALIEGSVYTDSLLTRIGPAQTLRLVHRLLKVDSVCAGLLDLEMLLSSRQFDLVILHELPCSLARVRAHLAQTPGYGKVLWIRQNQAVLLDEEQTRPSLWTILAERFGPKLEKWLKFLDRWEA